MHIFSIDIFVFYDLDKKINEGGDEKIKLIQNWQIIANINKKGKGNEYSARKMNKINRKLKKRAKLKPRTWYSVRWTNTLQTVILWKHLENIKSINI